MYKKSGSKAAPQVNKNPARVAGGLRAQGVDTFKILGENGSEELIPTHRYVQSLERQIRTQKELSEQLKKKVAKLETNIQQLTSAIKNNY